MNGQIRGGRSLWQRVALGAGLAGASWLGAGLDVAHAAPPNNTPIFRLQARFYTANVGDAETDDAIKVSVNGANTLWLDSGRDDHERNSIETFDLRMEGVNTIADLDFFRIEKGGSDGWGLRRVELLVNGRVIYGENFSGNLWLDNEGGHSRVFLMDHVFMRQRSEWQNFVPPVRSNIVPNLDLQRRVEALVGDKLHDTGTDFIGGEKGAELFTLTTNSWRVDLDLEDQKQWPFPDLEYDVDFDLRVSCVNGQARFSVANVNSDASWPEDDWISGFIAGSFTPRFNELMKNYRFATCPGIALASNGDLHFSPRIPPVGPIRWLELLDAYAPISLHVATGEGTKNGGKGNFVATVKSTLKGDEKVELSFTLPPQIRLADKVIQVENEKGKYRLEVSLEEQKDGSSRVSFGDLLPSDLQVAYTLPLIYDGGKLEGDVQIDTSIRALDEQTAAEISTLRSATHFTFSKGQVLPGFTSTTNADYIDGK